MDEIIKYFSESGSVVSFIIAITIIVAMIKVAEKVISWVSGKLTAYYNFRHGKETEKEKVLNQDKKITEIDDKLDKVAAKMDDIVNHFDTFVVRQKSVNTILLRDKINYIYKDCIAKGYILEKQLQNFTYAYDEYVANGGNSYVINDVNPYIHTLKVFLSDEDAKAAGY